MESRERSEADVSSDCAAPLAGVRVVECASIILGPLAGQYLGDMGADVIKLEATEGDLTRKIGAKRSDGMAALFLSNNRNKRSISLDLKQPGAASVLHRLVASSDVFLHSVRSLAAARIGIAYNELKKHREDLIYCQVMGFSDVGPYAGKPAFDDIVQALSGLASLQEVIGGEPRYMPSILADKITALHAVQAIAFGLLQRDRTGKGQAIEVPMLESIAYFNMSEHLWGHAFEPPLGPMGYEPVSRAFRRPFPTLNGYVALLPYTDAHWHRFFEIIGRRDFLDDPRYSTFAGRQANSEMVYAELGTQLSLRTTAEWQELLGESDIPFATVNSLEDLLTDPHLEATGFWQLVEHPDEGLLRVPASPVKMMGSAKRPYRLPPRLGAHTLEILTELGYTAEETDRLLAQGVINAQ